MTTQNKKDLIQELMEDPEAIKLMSKALIARYQEDFRLLSFFTIDPTDKSKWTWNDFKFEQEWKNKKEK